MARTIKKVNSNAEAESIETVDNISVTQPEKKIKKFRPTDTIPCESITSGELGIVGIKSNINYRWANRGDITDVEYQDLAAAVMSNRDAIMRPRFIVRDEDFVSQFPQLNNVYKELYSVRDLKDILRMSPSQMENAIKALPTGAQESIKGLAATMIENGQLDSIKTIKKIDEIFGVNLSLMADM